MSARVSKSLYEEESYPWTVIVLYNCHGVALFIDGLRASQSIASLDRRE
ncbi:unnamed protein product [Larinioides sclopetarius]|uniref:Uncharacterized protein n=1 Tax=Larinioides sclopetarius TaxID=280406 RepID=A0AAV2BV70_9ARAC